MQRDLKQHHLQLLAIGGVIGAGFFMGASKTIVYAGPSVLLVYAMVGLFVFFTMRAMGELLLSNLNYRSFLDVVQDYLGDTAAFITGWTYWLCWLVVAIANTVAITGYVQFWYPDIPLWLPAFLNIMTVVGLNLLPVRWFGETELWLSMIKVLTIVALIMTGFYLVASGFYAPSGYQASLANLWNDGNLMPNGWMGFLAAFQLAVQASVGTELVGTAAAETRNPKYALPAAINRIPIRVAIFFVLSLSVIMMITPYEKIDAQSSPFVEMFRFIGISSAASFINFVALSAAVSSANSGIYSAGRMIYGLASQKNAPKIFTKLSKHGTPKHGILYSALYLSLSFLLLYSSADILQAFAIISTISSICFLIIWGIILCSYLRYRKIMPQLHIASEYKMPYGKFTSLLTLGFFGCVLFVFSLQPDTAIGLMFTPFWFIGLLVYRAICLKNAEKSTTDLINHESV